MEPSSSENRRFEGESTAIGVVETAQEYEERAVGGGEAQGDVWMDDQTLPYWGQRATFLESTRVEALSAGKLLQK